MTLLFLSWIATTPDPIPTLAQVEKQANEIQVIAQRIQSQAQATADAGRPVGLALLESDLATLMRHMKRLEAAVAELETLDTTTK
jgi:hypothetical protein